MRADRPNFGLVACAAQLFAATHSLTPHAGVY
jgi:hypothetical protein